ncbi:MAG: prepilin peptidase [Stellaceae bacterium]
MNTALHILAALAFSALMAAAAFEDFRRFVIPNWLILALVAVWPLLLAAQRIAPVTALSAVGVAALVFLVGAVLFARGYVGGGDVKLLCAAALWAGPAATPELLIVTAGLGGFLGLFLLSPIGAHLSLAGRVFFSPPGAATMNPAEEGRVPMPYGVAIAGAAVLVILQPFFG